MRHESKHEAATRTEQLVPTAIVPLRALIDDGNTDLHVTLLGAQYALLPSGNTISVPFRANKTFLPFSLLCISDPMLLFLFSDQ